MAVPSVFLGWLPFLEPSHDKVATADSETLRQMYRDREQLTARQRLDMMWRTDEYGNPSPELEGVVTVGILAGMTGAVMGSYKDSRGVLLRFKEDNRHTLFRHPREAQVILQELMLYHMMKGAVKGGLKLGLLCTSYALATVSLDVALGSSSSAGPNPLAHGAVGLAIGSLWKVPSGPRAMLGSGLVLGALGLGEGSASWVFVKLSGESYHERWSRQLEDSIVQNEKVQRDLEERLAKLSPRDRALGDAEEGLQATDWLGELVLKARNLWAPPEGGGSV